MVFAYFLHTVPYLQYGEMVSITKETNRPNAHAMQTQALLTFSQTLN